MNRRTEFEWHYHELSGIYWIWASQPHCIIEHVDNDTKCLVIKNTRRFFRFRKAAPGLIFGKFCSNPHAPVAQKFADELVFDVSKVKESSFLKSDLTPPPQIFVRVNISNYHHYTLWVSTSRDLEWPLEEKMILRMKFIIKI